MRIKPAAVASRLGLDTLIQRFGYTLLKTLLPIAFLN
jgi:hypothetical protein